MFHATSLKSYDRILARHITGGQLCNKINLTIMDLVSDGRNVALGIQKILTILNMQGKQKMVHKSSKQLSNGVYKKQFLIQATILDKTVETLSSQPEKITIHSISRYPSRLPPPNQCCFGTGKYMIAKAYSQINIEWVWGGSK